jgi:hypothetical protein
MPVKGVPVVVAALGVLAVFAACSRRSSPEPSKRASTSATAPETDGDALVIEKLRAAGSDLSKPIVVDLYLYFPTEVAARTVAGTMRTEGYSVEVRPPVPDIPSWACVARKPILLTAEGMRDVRAKLSVLAKSFGGEYDGWEAPVGR